VGETSGIPARQYATMKIGQKASSSLACRFGQGSDSRFLESPLPLLTKNGIVTKYNKNKVKK